ncbi:hypothetical protein ACFWFZ_11295 [Streptomyces sp. NPDC060232]|uniref:hypothetical protein n=1 Tax=Streptomyces sp. NPDC060232 TaxID=3347079 RepID=UPI0036519831
MTGIYALISPGGELELREGVPERMLKDADPHTNTPSGFLVLRASWGAHGLHGHVGAVSVQHNDAYPLNPVARPLVDALGGPDQCYFGNLTICGSLIAADSGESEMRGLVEAQQRLVCAVHAAVSHRNGARWRRGALCQVGARRSSGSMP